MKLNVPEITNVQQNSLDFARFLRLTKTCPPFLEGSDHISLFR